MFKLVLLVATAVIVRARPSTDLDVQNVITVPPNCPPGQEYINGSCRDVWKLTEQDQLHPMNIITVPPNCPPGQEYINGQCRDIWHKNTVDSNNVVIVPPNCAPGQQLINGVCRDVWIKEIEPDTYSKYDNLKLKSLIESFLEALQSTRNTRSAGEAKAQIQNRNIINVPNQCPIGQLPDQLGICRPIFGWRR